MRTLFLTLMMTILSFQMDAQFDQYFYNKTLRFDFFHCGNSVTDEYYVDELIEEPYWGGSHVNLIDSNFYGSNYVKMYDSESGKLLYSRGYCTVFNEWQTVDEAKQTRRCCNESVVLPFPKKDVRIEILNRNKKGGFEKKFEYLVNTNSMFIKKEHEEIKTFEVSYSGNPAQKVDIVLLSEGYTSDQYEQFKNDCSKFASALFTESPFKENSAKFNIRGVWAPSSETGVDIPGENIWKNTRLNASYYFFGLERYQLTYDFKSVRDLASHVPYDHIYILSNSKKYGGGAIYNFYGLSASDNVKSSSKIYVHEFGHLFLGLADEYVGVVAYNEFYPTNVEPWEPNITTLKNFDSKWKNKLAPGTPIPTPADSSYNHKLGVYEGGGYSAKGVYRPWINCMMNNLHNSKGFCPVCNEAINKMIDFYCK